MRWVAAATWALSLVLLGCATTPGRSRNAAAESGHPTLPTPPNATEPRLQRGYAAFRQQDWGRAAVDLHAGSHGADAGEARRAELFIAVALHQLQLRQGSSLWFLRVGEDVRHPELLTALPWIARLALDAPERYELTMRGALSSYREQLRQRVSPHTWGRLHAELGAAAQLQGRCRQALTRLLTVPVGHPDYFQAQYRAAMCEVAERRAAAAADRLERLERGLTKRSRRLPAAERSLLSLTRLAQGRLDHSRAFRPLTQGQLSLDRQRLGRAVASYDRVINPPAGRPEREHLELALVEQAWTLFALGDKPRALGNLRTLDSLASRLWERAEAEVLRSAMYWEHCEFGAVHRHLRELETTWAPRLRALARAREHRSLSTLRSSDRTLDHLAREALRGASYRRPQRIAERARQELERLRMAPPWFGASALGTELHGYLQLLRDSSREDARAGLAAFLAERHRALQTVLGQARRLRARAEIRRAVPGEPHSQVFSVLTLPNGEERVTWTFNGEHWPDEVGTLRERVAGRCAQRPRLLRAP